MTARTAAPSRGQSAVVIGGGHNGLITALILARAGWDVTVTEQGEEPGGCVWTQQRDDGIIAERGAFEHGGIYDLARELGLTESSLGKDRLEYVEHPVVTGFVFGDGHQRIIRTNAQQTIENLGADGPAYAELVERADMMFSMLSVFEAPPTFTQVAAALAHVPGGDAMYRSLLQSAETLTHAAIEDPYLRTAICLQASHAQVPHWAPGSGLFAFLLPRSHGSASVRPVGGSRALTNALVAALERAGGRVLCAASVERISGQGPSGVKPAGPFGGSVARATTPSHAGAPAKPATVTLADGTTLSADVVVSTLGLPRTADLVTDDAPQLRAAARDLHSGHFNVAELTVTIIRDQPFDLGFEDPLAIYYAIDAPEDLRRGFGEVLAGLVPSRPWSMVGQVAQPTHVTASATWLSSIVPLKRADGPWTEETEAEAGDHLIDHVSHVLGVDIRQGAIDVLVSGPATWARRIGGDGNPNHLDNTIDQLLGWRPPGHADGRTELPWLYLAGAGQHPGGGLSGASALSTAHAILDGPATSARTVRERLYSEVTGLWKGFQAYRHMRKGAS